MLNQREIIVIGGNHHNTLGVIRGLGFGGVKPIVILHVGEEQDPYVSHSRFIKEIKLLTVFGAMAGYSSARIISPFSISIVTIGLDIKILLSFFSYILSHLSLKYYLFKLYL